MQSCHEPREMTSGASGYTKSPPRLAQLYLCLLLRLQASLILDLRLMYIFFIYLLWLNQLKIKIYLYMIELIHNGLKKHLIQKVQIFIH